MNWGEVLLGIFAAIGIFAFILIGWGAGTIVLWYIVYGLEKGVESIYNFLTKSYYGLRRWQRGIFEVIKWLLTGAVSFIVLGLLWDKMGWLAAIIMAAVMIFFLTAIYDEIDYLRMR